MVQKFFAGLNRAAKSMLKNLKIFPNGAMSSQQIYQNGCQITEFPPKASEVGGAWTQVNPNREVSRVIGARLAIGMAMRTKIIRIRDCDLSFGRYGHHGFGHHGRYAIVTSHFGHHGDRSGEFTTQKNFLGASRASLLHKKILLRASREFTKQKKLLSDSV